MIWYYKLLTRSFMNKFISNIIGIFILNKTKRDIFKRSLQFGCFNYFQSFRKDKKKDDFDNYLSVVAIAKNEGCYFKEWIDYHRLVGVEKFYIYDNNSSDNTYDVLKPYIDQGIVVYQFFPGMKKQIPAYADCIKKCRRKTKWLAAIDLDEFLVPLQGQSLADAIRKINHTHPNIAQIIVGWVIYGSSHHKKKPQGLVIENFLWREAVSASTFWHKSIINPRKVFIPHCHAFGVHGKTVNENGDITSPLMPDSIFTVPADFPLPNKLIRINHYAVKSQEEFAIKKYKGDAIKSQQIRSDDYFTYSDRNDIYDDTMLKFAAKIKK